MTDKDKLRSIERVVRMGLRRMLFKRSCSRFYPLILQGREGIILRDIIQELLRELNEDTVDTVTAFGCEIFCKHEYCNTYHGYIS